MLHLTQIEPKPARQNNAELLCMAILARIDVPLATLARRPRLAAALGVGIAARFSGERVGAAIRLTWARQSSML